ncbi:HYDIN protein, partial [Scytalopus superciliaris]|nr:HYDIN protein [Scytalopus superciliaris]
LTPSAFQREMSLTTKQRLASTRETYLPQIVQRQDRSGTSYHKLSAVDPDQTLFQPFPSEVVFQNYIPHKVCEMPLALRNRDKANDCSVSFLQVPRLVKVTLESSPYFKLVGPSGVYRKVPPGMCSTLRILFTPGENKDYCHQLLCITEREEFIVPIRAIGARAVLDFPDQLDFPVCPVKCSTQKTLLVHNVGNREACYQISTQSPFSVAPAMGTLGIGDTMQVTVEFHPLQAGGHSASLVVHYDTGQDTHTSLHGSAMNVHIRLDRNSVTVEKTYITLSNHSTVMIHNQSNVIAHFQWRRFATQEEEDQLKQRLCHRLCRQEKHKVDNFLKWCRVDTTRQERLSLLSRIFQSKRAKVQGDPMLFSDGIFTIEPLEGEVWPNSSEVINVIFKPREARVYKQAAYCDISGRETRLPLHLIGEGLGPWLHFYFEELDIGKVSVIAVHRYEAILCNKGPIEASFHLIPPTTTMGCCFTFLPQQGIVAPDGLQTIQISFRTTIPGKFKEQFRFRVTECPKPVTLTIRGCVIGPTFHFNVPALHFGDISFGFPHTLSCRLTNTSLMPMTFHLRIPEDGLGEPSTSSFVHISSGTHPSWRKGARGRMKPKEFTIWPCRGTICPQEFQDIQVTLCSNTVRRYKMELVVDVDGVGKKMSALPLTARCVVPLLRVLNPVVAFGRCCLKVPYEKMLTLVNDSNFPGCYEVLPQEDKKDAPVWYSSPVPCGIIKAHSSVKIPFTLEAQLLGEHDIIAGVAVFGSEESPLKIHLESTGQGPVVYVYPNEINLGTIQVLQDISQTLHLSNQSVIPAAFWAEMAGTCSRWRTEPSKGVIPPKTEMSVRVTANLNDTGKFEDEVKLFIENSHMNIIPVQAVGIGTTIVTDKPFGPELSFKPHFSLTACCYQFKITNKGRHVHHLYWTTEGFSISEQRRNLGTTKGKKASKSLRPISPVFKLQPPQMELMPGQSMDMVLEGFSSTPQEVKERLLCHAIVGREKTKRQIMQVDVTCEFIFPTVQISSRAIPFRVEKLPSDVLTLQYKPLSLKNTSSLPLSIVLDLKHPFLICDVEQQPLPTDGQPMKLEIGEERHLCIQFDPAYKKDLHSWVAETTLKMGFLEHPHEEHISIRGEVYFPNLCIQTKALDFGCIMNDTEKVHYVEMTNCSPIPVHYHWSFQTDSELNTISQQVQRTPWEQCRMLPNSQQVQRTPWEQCRMLPNSQQVQRTPWNQRLPLKSCLVNLGALEWELAPCSVSCRTEAACGAVKKDVRKLGSLPSPCSLQLMVLVFQLLPSSDVEPQSPATMKALRQLMEVEHFALGVEEVFDILPVSGVLWPGESQQVPFTFFGHANIIARVTALCSVEGGPTYKVVLSGEASCISYHLGIREIDCGLQLFNEVIETEFILQNTGRIGFTYMVLNPSTATADCPLPGVPVVMPSTNYIEPGKEQVLNIYYLPGIPGVFHRTFQLQVGHLEPVEISLKGEGIFLRISVDLP